MHGQLTHQLASQRAADLRRAAEQARLVSRAADGNVRPRRTNPFTRLSTYVRPGTPTTASDS
jgi:hypothetical protein